MYISMFGTETPVLLEQLANSPEMQRLSDIGMHCGCEYTGCRIYKQARSPYTRLMHSAGVSEIVWHYTSDIRQAIAGLLHDIATPVFAHTIDFMNNDHMTQESTEKKTAALIRNSESIMELIGKNNIKIEDIVDYHRYPIADNDMPMLSADRLEYTLGNGYLLYHAEADHIKEICADLAVAKNEHGAPELCFRSIGMAKSFMEIAMRNSRLYVSDEDRFSMQYLADIVRSAIRSGVLTDEDLYTTERDVIGKLKAHPASLEAWNEYKGISAVSVSDVELVDRYGLKVFAKKRYIDPLVLSGDGTRRISEIDAVVNSEIESFLCLDFDKWLYAV